MLKKVLLGAVTAAILYSPLGFCAESKSNPAVLIFKNKKGQKTTYYKSDVLRYKQSLPEEIRAAADEAVFSDLRDQMLVDLLFAEAVDVEALENDPEVLSELKIAKLEIMKKVWLQRELNKMIKDEDLVRSYKKIKESLVGKKVYNTAIIIVDSEAEAQSILQKINAGHDFGELAKQHSIETSTKERGGEIGFLPEEHLEKLLDADAAKKIKVLKDGAHSSRVFSKDGKYILVRKLETKDAELPEYKQVVQQLKALEMQKAVATLAKELFKKRRGDVEARDYKGNKETPLKKLMEITTAASVETTPPAAETI